MGNRYVTLLIYIRIAIEATDYVLHEDSHVTAMLISGPLIVQIFLTASVEGWVCKRTDLEVNYGFDAALRPLVVDVGKCAFISDTNSTDEPVTLCVPDTSEMQTHSNRSGPFDVAVVVSCREVNASSSCCGRHARWTTFFSNSRYERTVDVGTCEGQCAGESNICAPKRSSQYAVGGPNGALNVAVVEECACADSRCRREDYFQAFWEVETQINADGNESRVIVKDKVINIGRCTGECSGVNLQPRCYLCLQTSERPRCAPSSITVHTFVGLEGGTTPILAIRECSCLTG